MLLSSRGVLQGLLTKKDVSYVLNGADESRRTAGTDGGYQESGIVRGDAEEEAAGLLGGDEGINPVSPGIPHTPLL